MRVAVVGAGSFGGWTALQLRRRGAAVRLIEAWAPGHSRASSGGETRVIRATYGSHRAYTKMAVRAMRLWTEHDTRFGGGLLRKTGALWMFGEDQGFAPPRSRPTACRWKNWRSARPGGDFRRSISTACRV